MVHMKKFISLFIALLLLLLVLPSANGLAAPFEKKLQDDWAFYAQQLLTVPPATAPTTMTSLPVEFKALGEPTSSYGTFIYTVQLEQQHINEMIGLYLPFTYSAAKIYINGELYEEVGRVSDNADEHERKLQSVIVPIKVNTPTLQIAIQLSSFEHIRGGFSGAPVLGDWASLSKGYLFERYTAIFLMAIIFIVGAMTVAIGVVERQEKMLFVFGLFSLVVAVRGVVAVPFLYHELPIPLSYEWATRLEYITTNVCFSLYALFIYLLYNKLFSKWILYPSVLILWALALLAVFAPIPVFQGAFFSIGIPLIIFFLYNIWIMIRALRSKLFLARSLLLGVAFVFTGLIIDFLAGTGAIYAPPTANIMITLNVLLILFSLCQDYVRNMRKLHFLNTALDEQVKEKTAHLQKANTELQQMATIDRLTQVYNRHALEDALTKTFTAATQSNEPLSLLMLDVDEFKQYNDFYGHPQGDALLVQLTQLIQQVLPANAIFARYGGEEFTVLLPNSTLREAIEVGERIRTTVEHAALAHENRPEEIVTLSIGCAEYKENALHSMDALLSTADKRLYYAKQQGRNRVVAT